MKAKNYRKDAISVQGNGIDETTPVDGDALVYSTSSYAPTQVAMKTHSHAISDVTDLQTSLDTKVAYDDFYSEGIYRNAIINGNFDIWQRGTSFPDLTSTHYTADRWRIYVTAGNVASVSRKQFDVGQTDVPGNPKYYTNIDLTAYTASAVVFEQMIEDVASFAGQTVTLSFFARSSNNFSAVAYAYQEFGTGGSTIVGTIFGTVDLTPNWQRFVFSIPMPGISGKIVGDNSKLQIQPLRLSGVCNVDIAQVQLNIGDKALPFCPRPIAEELALCRRYYQIIAPGRAHSQFPGAATVDTSTRAMLNLYFSPMRVIPTVTSSGVANFAIRASAGGVVSVTDMTIYSENQSLLVDVTTAGGLTAGQACMLRDYSGSAALYLDAEL